MTTPKIGGVSRRTVLTRGAAAPSAQARGILDARSMITRTYTIDQARQSVQDTADRTIITGVIEFT